MHKKKYGQGLTPKEIARMNRILDADQNYHKANRFRSVPDTNECTSSIKDGSEDTLRNFLEPGHDKIATGDEQINSINTENSRDDSANVATSEIEVSPKEASSNEKSEHRKLSLFELEEELCKRNKFIVINNLVYCYDNKAQYYKLIDQDDVIYLYRNSVDKSLYGVSSLSRYKDLYKFLKTDPNLIIDNHLSHETGSRPKIDNSLLQKTYCPLKNGIYYFDKGELKYKKHSYENCTFTCLDASFIENANIEDAPAFSGFINDITGNRNDLKDRLLMALGYLLFETKKGKFFFLAGFKPDTGKSVLFNFIQQLYPQEAVSNLPISDIGGRFESESLLTSRINISLDLSHEPLSSSAIAKIKQITGGDTVEVQRKNKTSRKIDHPVKLVFASNHAIILKNDDKAFWNRLIFLPFMNPVKKEDKDPELGDKLWDERNIIVSYLFTFVEKLEKINYEFPPIPEDISKGYALKSKEDYLQNFIDERCEIGTTEDFCLVSDMRKEFKNYQFYNPGPHCTPTEFNNFMESHGVYRVRTSGARGFSGIRIRERKRNLLDSAIDRKML